MSDEIDYALTSDQWETLKALRVPVSASSALNRFVLDDLVVLGLATMSDNMPAITPKGRRALIRGSSRLWDVAA
jgi:ribosomal protein S19E (S16A)